MLYLKKSFRIVLFLIKMNVNYHRKGGFIVSFIYFCLKKGIIRERISYLFFIMLVRN